MTKKTLFALLLMLAAVSALTYWNSLSGEFVWDDINLIVYDYQIRDLSFLPDIFTRDFFGFQDNARKYGYYRPVITISYMIDYALWGLNPTGYHLTNILTHLGAVVFLFFILLRLFRGRALAPFLASLLFAVHPIHTESVTWIAGRTDTVCGLFLFLSMGLYMRWADGFAARKGIAIDVPGVPPADPAAGTSGALALWASIFIFLVAMLAKEMAIILPAVLAVYVVAYHTGFSWKRLWPFVPSFLGFGAVIGGYSVYRFMVIEFSTQAKDPWGVVPTVISFFWTILYYVLKLAWPAQQTGYIQNELIYSVLSPKVIAAFVFLGVFAWLAWTAWERDRAVGFLCLFRRRVVHAAVEFHPNIRPEGHGLHDGRALRVYPVRGLPGARRRRARAADRARGAVDGRPATGPFAAPDGRRRPGGLSGRGLRVSHRAPEPRMVDERDFFRRRHRQGVERAAPLYDARQHL
ncbi:MAG: hypothetical protein M5R36_13310 [Deltaproteobacteria bacterium]|nr:hypothetical protein [Deltaproteobacteria bacterium]